VTGLVHPDHITAKARAQPGDLLLLTKPLGTGVITTAHKRGVVAEQHLQAAIDSMVKLNRRAAELATSVGLHSATDITGYGLLGHAEELAHNSGVALQIVLEQVPLLIGAHEYARQGVFPGGLGRNRDYLLGTGSVRLAPDLEEALAQLLFLRPLYPMDALKPYLVPPPALAFVPADLRVVNPDFNYLFGPSTLKQGDFPAPRSEWVERRAFYELYPFTGPLWKRRYDLNVSAEGLDSFLTRMAQLFGFEVESLEPTVLRMEAGHPVPGYLIVLRLVEAQA